LRVDDDREREEARGRARGRRELPEQSRGGAPDQRHGDGGHPDQAGGSLHRDADPEFHQEPVSKSLPRLPSSGLQAGEWNQYAFEIENRGKLPARNVQVELAGDVEAKGVLPIPEIGVGEVVPVRMGVKPKSAGAIPMSVGVSYQRLFDENRYEVQERKQIKVEPEAT